jgi:hypothetical protein
MRMLMSISIPHEEFNEAVRDGTAGEKLNQILDDMNPEAIYFTTHDGQRAAVAIVDVPDPSTIPSLAEPWFLTFDADVDFRPVMTLADIKRSGLEELGQQWGA